MGFGAKEPAIREIVTRWDESDLRALDPIFAPEAALDDPTGQRICPTARPSSGTPGAR